MLSCGYTQVAVRYFDVYHVEGVVDIPPIIPRGPEYGGLLNLFKGTWLGIAY